MKRFLQFSFLPSLCAAAALCSHASGMVVFGFSTYANYGTTTNYYAGGINNVVEGPAYINIGALPSVLMMDQASATVSLANQRGSSTAVDTLGHDSGLSLSVVNDRSLTYSTSVNNTNSGAGANTFTDPGFIGCNKGAVMIFTISGLDANVSYDLVGLFGGNAGSQYHSAGVINGYLDGVSSVSSWSGATAGEPSLDQSTGTISSIGSGYRSFAGSGLEWSNLVADQNGEISFYYSTTNNNSTNRGGFSYLTIERSAIPEPATATLGMAGLLLLGLGRHRR